MQVKRLVLFVGSVQLKLGRLAILASVVLQANVRLLTGVVALCEGATVGAMVGKITEPHVGYAPHTMSVVIILGPMPPTAILEVGICATPATMALGGVPTGMWNAMEHASVAGIIR